MNILYFHQHFSFPEGTTGNRSFHFANALVDKSHKVTIICGSYKGGVTGLASPFIKGVRRGCVNGLNIIEFDLTYANQHSFTKRASTFIRFVAKSIKVLYTEKYDLVFATSTPLTASIPGIVSKVFTKKPFVFEVRDLWPALPRAMKVINNPLLLKTLSCLEWCSYKAANRIIGLSPGMVEGIAKRSAIDKPIALIPNGCDLDIFNQRTKVWRPNIISEKDFLVLYAGTHGLANGLDAVLDAAAELKARERHDIKILFVGDGKEKARLQARAKKELLDNVVFHEPVNKYKLVGLMQSANIGLQILKNIPEFYHGTSPNKFFDYISAGLPVLNNYPGWIAQLIKEYDCGVVIPPDNTLAFADALEKASHNSELVKMGKNGIELATEKFNRKKLAEQFVNFIEEAVE